MTKAISLLIPALLLAVTPLSAGYEGERCSEETTVCITKMVQHMKRRGWVGIEWDDADGRPRITLVVEGSPAAAAGVKSGDLVTALNGVATGKDKEAFYREIKSALVPDNSITLSVMRAGEPLDLELTLIAVPDHILAQWVGKHVLEHHVDLATAGEAAESP